MGVDAGGPMLWVVAGCLFEVSLPEGAGATTWHWAEPQPGVTLLGESVRGGQRHYRFRAEADDVAAGSVTLRFRGRTAVGAVVLRSVEVGVAPEKEPDQA